MEQLSEDRRPSAFPYCEDKLKEKFSNITCDVEAQILDFGSRGLDMQYAENRKNVRMRIVLYPLIIRLRIPSGEHSTERLVFSEIVKLTMRVRSTKIPR